MLFEDALWTGKWQHTPFPKLIEGRVPDVGSVGCDDEPVSSLWCACLAQAMGPHYREGMTVLDYGCGFGRFFNFLTGRLNDFRYYGLEVEGTPSKHGDACLDYAGRTFGGDPRARFGAIESALEAQAIREADVVLLGSVFSHIDRAMMDAIFRKFLPVTDAGGAVVFSVMIGDSYAATGPGFLLDMGPAFYQTVTYTDADISGYVRDLGLVPTRAETFHAPREKQPHHSSGGNMQTIYRAEAPR
ncbi:class I SAM-dependent methyltransferase [Roseibium sp.]|uniref:class I SAM-dependent methyltransferase n=1 Tax=Roseibium sp. TaxID=1936156 RepID=UPI003266C7FC